MTHRDVVWLDAVWAGHFVYDEGEGKVHRKLFQPNRDKRLDLIKRMRTDGVVPSDSPLGRWCLCIQAEDWERLGRDPKWCELHSTDFETQQRAMRRFLVSPDSAPFRVQDKAS